MHCSAQKQGKIGVCRTLNTCTQKGLQSHLPTYESYVVHVPGWVCTPAATSDQPACANSAREAPDKPGLEKPQLFGPLRPMLLVQEFDTCSQKTLTQHPPASRGTSFHIGLLTQSFCRLTQMSHLPGKNLSGMRAAYSAAPVMYRHAMSASQPICPIVAAFRSPSEMTKCRVGITPLRPRPRNTPGR